MRGNPSDKSSMDFRSFVARQMGRAAKLLWWTLTLQLVPRVREAIDARRKEGRAPNLLAGISDARAQLYDAFHFLIGGYSPKVSIVMATCNAYEFTKLCIDNILQNTTHPRYEIVVVDNGSSDATLDYLRAIKEQHGNVRVIENADNRGFAAAANQGLRLADGEILVLLHSDTVVPRGWLRGLLRCLSDPLVGLAGPVTNTVGNEARIDVDYRSFDGMLGFAARWMEQHVDCTLEMRVMAMFCVAMRRELFERLGPLDEQFGIGWFEDEDYSNRIRAAGYKLVCTAETFVHHFGQASFKAVMKSDQQRELWQRNLAYYETKWGKWTSPSKQAPEGTWRPTKNRTQRRSILSRVTGAARD